MEDHNLWTDITIDPFGLPATWSLEMLSRSGSVPFNLTFELSALQHSGEAADMFLGRLQLSKLKRLDLWLQDASEHDTDDFNWSYWERIVRVLEFPMPSLTSLHVDLDGIYDAEPSHLRLPFLPASNMTSLSLYNCLLSLTQPIPSTITRVFISLDYSPSFERSIPTSAELVTFLFSLPMLEDLYLKDMFPEPFDITTTPHGTPIQLSACLQKLTLFGNRRSQGCVSFATHLAIPKTTRVSITTHHEIGDHNSLHSLLANYFGASHPARSLTFQELRDNRVSVRSYDDSWLSAHANSSLRNPHVSLDFDVPSRAWISSLIGSHPLPCLCFDELIDVEFGLDLGVRALRLVGVLRTCQKPTVYPRLRGVCLHTRYSQTGRVRPGRQQPRIPGGPHVLSEIEGILNEHPRCRSAL